MSIKLAQVSYNIIQYFLKREYEINDLTMYFRICYFNFMFKTMFTLEQVFSIQLCDLFNYETVSK